MPFQESAQITLDGSGNGTVRLGQVPAYRRRSYIRVTVSIDTGDLSAVTGGEARMYRGDAIPSNFITGTNTPWLDTSTLLPEASELVNPLQLTILFTNCDPGATAVVNATYLEERQGVKV